MVGMIHVHFKKNFCVDPWFHKKETQLDYVSSGNVCYFMKPSLYVLQLYLFMLIQWYFLYISLQGPLLLTWINFNLNMDK